MAIDAAAHGEKRPRLIFFSASAIETCDIFMMYFIYLIYNYLLQKATFTQGRAGSQARTDMVQTALHVLHIRYCTPARERFHT